MSTSDAVSNLLSAVHVLQRPHTPAGLVLAAEHAMAGVEAILSVVKRTGADDLPSVPRANETFRCLALGATLTRRLCVVNQLEARHSCCTPDCKIGVVNQQCVDLLQSFEVK